MGTPSLLVAPDYLELLADVRPDKFDRAAVRWHGRLELETPTLTVAESQLALAALGALRRGQHDAAGVVRKLLRTYATHSATAGFLVQPLPHPLISVNPVTGRSSAPLLSAPSVVFTGFQ